MLSEFAAFSCKYLASTPVNFHLFFFVLENYFQIFVSVCSLSTFSFYVALFVTLSVDLFLEKIPTVICIIREINTSGTFLVLDLFNDIVIYLIFFWGGGGL